MSRFIDFPEKTSAFPVAFGSVTESILNLSGTFSGKIARLSTTSTSVSADNFSSWSSNPDLDAIVKIRFSAKNSGAVGGFLLEHSTINPKYLGIYLTSLDEITVGSVTYMGTLTPIKSTPFIWSANTWYLMRIQIKSSINQYAIKVWPYGTCEPSSWFTYINTDSMINGTNHGFLLNTHIGNMDIDFISTSTTENEVPYKISCKHNTGDGQLGLRLNIGTKKFNLINPTSVNLFNKSIRIQTLNGARCLELVPEYADDFEMIPSIKFRGADGQNWCPRIPISPLIEP